MTRRRVVVIGGGISGLVAAYSLATEFEVVVIEAAPRFGGKLKTVSFRGRTLDLGPDAFITRTDSAAQLCRDLGLGDQLLAPATASAAIFSRGSLRPFPKGLVLGIPTDLGALWRSGVLPRSSVVRAGLDLVMPTRSLPHDISLLVRSGAFDPSVSEVVSPRFGRAVLDSLVDPLIGGINASEVDTLSFASSVPRLVEQGAGRRSLMRALRPLAGGAERSGRTSLPGFLGLVGGLATLIDRLVDLLLKEGVVLRSSCASTSIRRNALDSPAWTVRLEEGELSCDAVVLALPGFAASDVLGGVDEEMARECAEIAYASVVTGTFAWRSEAVPAALDRFFSSLTEVVPGPTSSQANPKGGLPGSGVLVPRGRGQLITAATFTSTKWPRSANPGEIVVRASAGRHLDERAVSFDDESLKRAMLGDIGTVLGITMEPIDVHIERWPRSFPQYERGHAARVARLEQLATHHEGLSLCGAAFFGIGIPACVESGFSAAAQVRRVLSRSNR